MATFKKKDLNELVGGDMTSIGGGRTPTNNSEIETGPVQKQYDDKSDYKAGVPTTTDKVTSRYRQDIPWFAVYSYGGSNVTGINRASESRIITKKTVEEKIDDLVKKSKSTDLTDKNYDYKISKLIDSIEDMDLDDKQLSSIENVIAKKKNKVSQNKTL